MGTHLNWEHTTERFAYVIMGEESPDKEEGEDVEVVLLQRLPLVLGSRLHGGEHWQSRFPNE